MSEDELRAFDHRAAAYNGVPENATYKLTAEVRQLTDLLHNERLECGHLKDLCRVQEDANRALTDERDDILKRCTAIKDAVTRYVHTVEVCGATLEESMGSYEALLRIAGFRPRIRAVSVAAR